MAEKLLLYYKYMSDLKGLAGKIELAKETKLPSTEAAVAPDSPENIVLFKAAVSKLTGRPAPSV